MSAELAVACVLVLFAILALCYALKRSGDLNAELTSKVMSMSTPYPVQTMVDLQRAQAELAQMHARMTGQVPPQAGQPAGPFDFHEEST